MKDGGINKERAIYGVIGIILVGVGFAMSRSGPSLTGKPAPSFGPYMIFLGVLFLFLALVRWGSVR